MVSSIDGKITKWDAIQDVSTWTSSEDQSFFMSMLDSHKLIIMGKNTYEAAKNNLKEKFGRMRIVMTSHPQEYASESNSGISFTSESPKVLVSRLEKEGHAEALLLGGGRINASFFKEGLVNELYLTIEPKIFGKGKMLVGDEELDINLKLVEIKQLNNAGTLLLHYSI